ncbi:MAG: hypothetical protein JHC31_01985 [Sulfurihydrogenibium sp.]|jgi:uncharacterized protein involved in exopolysaccharide biosynthesis|nr:hypothetical protein [Sulfurihydrogenibium sp.]
MQENKTLKNQEICQEDEIDLFELFQIIWNNRFFIAKIVLGITILTAIISFILPKTYTSESVIVPVTKSSSGSSLSAIAALVGLPAVGGDQATANVVAVLNSNTLRERVVKDLNLLDEILKDKKNEFKRPYQEAGIKLKDYIKINEDKKNGTIKIEVDWKDPDKAQKINESIIKNLRQILNEKSFTVAKMNRIFYENELNKTLESLKLAMNKLNEYQKTKKVIMPEQQLQSQLALYGSLISEKIELEGRLRNLSNIYNPEAPQIKEIQTRLSYINQKISEIEGEINTKSPISTEKTLEALPDYMQLYLQVQQLKGKYEVLAKLLEQSRLDELKENLYVEVIDNPTYPEKPSKPKKILMVTVAFISSLFLAIFIVFIREYIRSRRMESRSI